MLSIYNFPSLLLLSFLITSLETFDDFFSRDDGVYLQLLQVLVAIHSSLACISIQHNQYKYIYSKTNLLVMQRGTILITVFIICL